MNLSPPQNRSPGTTPHPNGEPDTRRLISPRGHQEKKLDPLRQGYGVWVAPLLAPSLLGLLGA